MKKYLILAAGLLSLNVLLAQTGSNHASPIRLIDKQLSLSSGVFNGGEAQQFFGFEANDKLVLSCIRLSRKGSPSIAIRDLNRGIEIFKRQSFDSIRNESIIIPAKGIYVVEIKTSSLLGKDVQLTVDRIPAAGARTAVAKSSADTSTVEVVHTTIRAYSKNSPQSNNSVLTLNLPPNTVYWVYWIGAGKEAIGKMDAFAASCTSIGAVYPSTDALVLFGKKQLSALPMTKTSASISYHFMDTKNTAAFKNKQQYSYYMWKSSEKITTEYATIPNAQQDLNMGISNESSNTSQDVEVRVVAFVVKPH